MSGNYPDDIHDYDDDPSSPFYEANTRHQELMEEILDDEDMGLYADMFNSQDSEDVLLLLRDFHIDQSMEAGKQLIAKLDEMLDARATDLLEED